jgi:hypothetical protein
MTFAFLCSLNINAFAEVVLRAQPKLHAVFVVEPVILEFIGTVSKKTPRNGVEGIIPTPFCPSHANQHYLAIFTAEQHLILRPQTMDSRSTGS